MTVKSTISVFLLATLVIAVTQQFGCKASSAEETAENTLRDSLMLVHDEVMPRMSEIHRLKKTLLNISEESKDLNPENLTEIEKVVKFLDAADEGMMSWMGQFKQPESMREKSSHQEIMAYLAIEQQRVEKVKTDIIGSIEAASSLIKTIEEGTSLKGQ
jgi:hypothetical protein